MMVKLRILILVLLGMALSGCASPADFKPANAVVNNYYAYLGRGDYKSILSLYDESFFGYTTKLKWESQLRGLRNSLGKYESHRVYRIKAQGSVISTDGNHVQVVVTAKYEKYPATEYFFIKKVGGKGGYKIVMHYINSDGIK